MTTTATTRTVQCSKLEKEAPGLAHPPFDGALGEEIYQRVSEEAWKSWRDDMMIKIINEYRLDLSDEKQYQKLIDQMCLFLNLKSGDVLEVENAERGRSS